MKKEEIHWGDWHRILLGTAPEQFLLEVFIRTAIIYLVLLIVLRLLGKRMGGQLTISELAVMLTLGAIVSVPMQVPDKGLLQGILVLICALVFQRGINYLAVKNDKIERVIQGTESLLVRNGMILAHQLIKMNISREQLIAVIRNKQIYNLGEVQSMYLEACGLFSVFSYAQPKPGLALLPPGDEEAIEEFQISDLDMVCSYCGKPAESESETHKNCNNCGANEWTPAVTA